MKHWNLLWTHRAHPDGHNLSIHGPGDEADGIQTALHIFKGPGAGVFAVSGCLLAVGAAAGAGGYELHQANKMDQLDEDLEKGRISSEEYLARKKQIEETAIFQ